MSVTKVPVTLNNIMGELQLTCDFHWKGCREVCTLNNLAVHVVSCTYGDIPPPVLVEHNYALPANMEASLVSSPTVSTLPTSRQKPVTPVQAVGVLLDHEEIEHVPGFEDLATKVVKRKIQLSNENREDLIRFKTKGQPFHMKTIRAPRKDNTEVSQKTLQLRAHIMNKTRSQVVGSSTMVAPQLQAELKSLERKRENLCWRHTYLKFQRMLVSV
ncbi:uncharacterized protein [Ptychodera flava]|uniref:uncharacterized protein n=1 Tax=Ptychodera flava TaxID=63121 RepID=UPI003969DDD1